jgi:AraC-like DNA-binding protein
MRFVSVIRSAALRGLRSTVAELGGDAEVCAQAVGMPVEALDSNDELISVSTAAAAVEYAAAKLDCPDLGLRMAVRQDLSTLGPLALTIQTASTLGDALGCAAQYVFLHSRANALAVQPDPYGSTGVVALEYAIHDDPQVVSQWIDRALAFMHRTITDLLGGSYGLRSVELPHLPRAPLATYERFFEAPVHAQRPAAMLRVPADLLNEPLKGCHPQLRQLAEEFLAEHSPSDGTRQFGSRVRVAIQQTLGTAPPDITTIAAVLCLHPRTLQRRLADENTTFATLLDDVRRNAARRYLTGTEMPMTQVAALLGFAEQSQLSRSCQRWWSTTPSQLRRRHADPGWDQTPVA